MILKYWADSSASLTTSPVVRVIVNIVRERVDHLNCRLGAKPSIEVRDEKPWQQPWQQPWQGSLVLGN